MNVAIPNLAAMHSNPIREQLINRLIVIWLGFTCLGITIVQIRSMDIGWSPIRDPIHIIVFIISVGLYYYRHKLSSQIKANTLITLCTMLGMVGSYTLGMLGGGIFFFIVAIVLMALMYSLRTVRIFFASVILFMGLIAIGFSSELLTLQHNANLFMSKPSPWAVYALGFAFAFLVSCVTAFSYRQAMEKLMDKIARQRDLLDENNKALQTTLEEIKTLQGIIPICSYCHQIRDDAGTWNQLDEAAIAEKDQAFIISCLV